MHRNRFVWMFTFAILTLLSICPLIFLSFYSFEEFCMLILSFIGKTDKLGEFQNRFLTISKFQFLRLVTFVIPILIFFLQYCIYQHSLLLKRIFFKIYSKIKISLKRNWKVVSNLPLQEKLFLIFFFTFIALTRTYYAVKMPITYDEAWTYLNFTQNGFLVSATYYPGPNNHILNSLLTNITYYFPFEAKINLRIPTVIVGIIASFAFWLCTTKLFNWKTGFVATAFFSSFFPAIYYGYLSRGYQLTLMAFVLGGYSVLKIIAEKDSARFWVLWIISSIVGLYAVPIYLYPFVSLALLIFLAAVYQGNLSKIKRLFISGIIVSISVFFLYLPVIIFSSVESVTSNKYVRPSGRMRVIEELFLPLTVEAFNYFFSFGFGWLMIIGLIVINYFFFQNKRLLSGVVFIFIIPFLLQIIHSVILPSRAWLFQIAGISLMIGMIFYSFENKLKFRNLTVMVFSVIILLLGILNFNYKINSEEKLAFEAETLSETICPLDIKSVYVNYDLIEVHLLYNFTVKNKKYDVYRAHVKGELSNDQLNNYDLVVLKKGSANQFELKNYERISDNQEFDAYLRIRVK